MLQLRYSWLMSIVRPKVWLFFMHNQKAVPYRVNHVRWSNGWGILKMEEVQDIEHARTIVGADVLWPQKWLMEHFSDRLLPEWIEGRSIRINQRYEGIVLAVEELPSQWLLKVLLKGRELLLPFVEGHGRINSEGIFELMVPESLIEP